MATDADFIADTLKRCLTDDAKKIGLEPAFLGDRLCLLNQLRRLAKKGEELAVMQEKCQEIREVLNRQTGF